MLTARWTLRASYLPLSPFSSSPFSHSLPLITVLVTQHMVYRGVSKQLPLTKIIGILILQFTLFALLFPHCFFPIHFLQYPLPKKCTPFFCQSSIQNLFSCFSLCYNFSLLLMNMRIIYIEGIKTTLLTLFGCILGFIGRKVDSALNNTRFMTSPSEFTNIRIFNFQLFQFSHLLQVVVIRRKKLPLRIPTMYIKRKFHSKSFISFWDIKLSFEVYCRSDSDSPTRRYREYLFPNYGRNEDEAKCLFLNYRRKEDEAKYFFLNYRRKEDEAKYLLHNYRRNKDEAKYSFLNYWRNEDEVKYSFLNYWWFAIANQEWPMWMKLRCSLKGAQAWDIRLRVFYINQTCMDRWLRN